MALNVRLLSRPPCTGGHTTGTTFSLSSPRRGDRTGEWTGERTGDVGFGGDADFLGGDSEGKRKTSCGEEDWESGLWRVDVRRLAGATGRLCSDCLSTSETLGFDVGFPVVVGFVLVDGDGGSGFTASSFVAVLNMTASSVGV